MGTTAYTTGKDCENGRTRPTDKQNEQTEREARDNKKCELTCIVLSWLFLIKKYVQSVLHWTFRDRGWGQKLEDEK